MDCAVPFVPERGAPHERRSEGDSGAGMVGLAARVWSHSRGAGLGSFVSPALPWVSAMTTADHGEHPALGDRCVTA